MPRKYTTQERIDAFWNKINKNGSIPQHCPELGNCWEWTGATLKNGYGYLRFENRENNMPHRVSWRLFYGDIPNNLWVLHKCDNRKCCNPQHLFLGTAKDNTQDMIAKKRRGGYRKLTPEQVSEIRQRYSQGNISQQNLADEYSISQIHVSQIILYKNWRN